MPKVPNKDMKFNLETSLNQEDQNSDWLNANTKTKLNQFNKKKVIIQK